MAEPIAVASFKLEALEESRGVVALRIAPRSIAAALKELKDFLLNQPRRPNVVEAGGDTKEKLVLFHPHAVPSLESVPAVCREFADAKEGAFVAHEVVTSYANFTYDEALRRLLPAGVEVPASFETIGHVAHLNLRPPQEPYRLLIAQVMVDKYPAIKVVLHKTGSITNEFRVFSMEVLADRVTGGTVPRIAGESDPALDTSVKQNGCVFALNFGDVYWNSRLEGEHNRLVETKFKTGDVVWDLMAGIGPFAVPAAKQHGCSVHANDLNPRSHHFLVENCKRNKVLPATQPGLRRKGVTTYNMCARAFMRHMLEVTGDALPHMSDQGETLHCVMNLPAAAPEFMDAFKHRFDPSIWRPQDLPMVHLYAFHKSDDAAVCQRHILERAAAALGTPIPAHSVEAHTVRDVAPKKLMLCCSFRLPPEGAFPPAGVTAGVDGCRESKRPKNDRGG